MRRGAHAAAALAMATALLGASCTLFLGLDGISDRAAVSEAGSGDATDEATSVDAGRDDAGDAAPDPDLIAWWPFDEGQGSVASDRSGHGHDGTLSDGASWVAAPSPSGNALEFDGVSGRAYVGDTPLLRALTDEFTFAARLYAVEEPTNPPRSQAVFFEAGESWYLKLNGAVPQLTDEGSQNALTVSDWPRAEWHHLTFTFKAGTGVKAFVDGNLEPFSSNTFNAPAPLKVNTLGVAVGGPVPPSSLAFAHCRLYDVRLYRRALSPTQVQELAR